MTTPYWTPSSKIKRPNLAKDFIRFREGHLYRLRDGVLVVIYDTFRERECSLRQGQGIVVQGNAQHPVGTHLYPIEPYSVVREEYPLTDQDKKELFNRGCEQGYTEAKAEERF